MPWIIYGAQMREMGWFEDASAGGGAALPVTWGLRFEFEGSPGFLVNSGTLGIGFNLTQGDICLG